MLKYKTTYCAKGVHHIDCQYKVLRYKTIYYSKGCTPHRLSTKDGKGDLSPHMNNCVTNKAKFLIWSDWLSFDPHMSHMIALTWAT